MNRMGQKRVQAFGYGCLGMVLLGYSAYQLLIEKSNWMLSPYLFPSFIGLLIGMAAIFYGFEKHPEEQEAAGKKEGYQRVLWVFAGSIFYVVLISFVRFIPATVLYLMGLYYYLGERRPGKVLLLSLGTVAFLYLLFEKILLVMLP